MKKSNIKILFFAFILNFSLYSCGGNKTEKNDEEVQNEETITETNVVPENETDFILPSPLQIAELFKSAGLNYIGDLTSPNEKASSFNSKYDQKLNFGVYSADMAYSIMNNQSQTTIDYLNTLRKLSEKLWMTDVFNSLGLRDRLEANVGNEDSLTYIMADLQIQLDDYLDENGMGATGSVIFAGAWIETMYIGTKVNESEKNKKLVARLSEQAVILGDLIKAVKQADENNEFSDLITDLETINKHFTGFDNESEEEFKLSDEEIKSLGEDIIKIRNKIIGN